MSEINIGDSVTLNSSGKVCTVVRWLTVAGTGIAVLKNANGTKFVCHELNFKRRTTLDIRDML